MSNNQDFLSDLAPLHVRTHLLRPERRRVSRRWLFGTVLVGATSLFMMGGALYGALDGQEQLTTPAVAYQKRDTGQSPELARKTNHPELFKKVIEEDPSNLMMVSTISQVGSTNVVKVRPFMNIKAPMALAPRPASKYPSFNPLTIFSESDEVVEIAKSSDFMYGADVEGEVTLNVTDFPQGARISKVPHGRISTSVRQQVQAVAHNLNVGDSYVSSLAFFDGDRFSQDNEPLVTLGNSDVRITTENVSILEKASEKSGTPLKYVERTIEVRSTASIVDILKAEGISEAEALELATVYETDLGEKNLREGDTLQTWMRVEVDDAAPEESQDKISIVKASLFRNTTHILSIARTDNRQLVYAPEPETPQALLQDSKEKLAAPLGKLPSVYDGIYRAALQQGLSMKQAGELSRIFAFDVDFRSRLKPTDTLEVFLSLEDGHTTPNENSEILYASLSLGDVRHQYYRFADKETGRIGYYDETGKSARKFLLRKPVPNGKFRSGYGMRRHPISRRLKLHGGVDWSAPRGTPIIAAGNGVVQQAKWAGGYGRQTIVRHANGYETSYSHQTAYAKGIKPGVRVRQGQIIGYVGSTGYSTGPHLHYEVKVNGNRVNPMRIRLPKGRVLQGEELDEFNAERERINALVRGNDSLEVASN